MKSVCYFCHFWMNLSFLNIFLKTKIAQIPNLLKIRPVGAEFRSNWTILRERMPSLAKATMLWNWSVKIHLYMTCGVVATSISGCDVCAACRVVCESVILSLLDKPEFFQHTRIFENKKLLKYQIYWKSFQWEPICSMRTVGQTDGRTDTTWLIVAFPYFV